MYDERNSGLIPRLSAAPVRIVMAKLQEIVQYVASQMKFYRTYRLCLVSHVHIYTVFIRIEAPSRIDAPPFFDLVNINNPGNIQHVFDQQKANFDHFNQLKNLISSIILRILNIYQIKKQVGASI